MSEIPAEYGNQKSKYPPANKTPADGTYKFHVFPLSDKFPATGTTSKGNVFCKVEFSASCGARVKTKFFVTEKASRRTMDFIKACSGVTVTPKDIADERGLAAAISDLCCGRKVVADIKRGPDSEYNGKTYPQYDVNGFRAPDPF